MSWTFNAISFSPTLNGQYIYDAWFTKKVLYSVDAALGGVSRTLDKGGVNYEPLTFVVDTLTALNYAALPALLGETATLEDGGDNSCTALLVEATPMVAVSPSSGVYPMRVTFEYVSDT